MVAWAGGDTEEATTKGEPRATIIAATKSKVGTRLAVELEHAGSNSSANHGSTTATRALLQ